MVSFKAGNPGDSLACQGPWDANRGGNRCLLGKQENKQRQSEEEGRGREGCLPCPVASSAERN